MLLIFSDQQCTNQIKTIVGYLKNFGASFVVSQMPTEVRKFSLSDKEGVLLQEGIDYTYNDGIIELSEQLNTGEAVAAFYGTDSIFSAVNTLSGDQKFLGNSSDENQRTKIQQLWLKNVSSNEMYIQTKIGCGNLLSNENDIDSQVLFSPDGTDWYKNLYIDNYSQLGVINPGHVLSFYIKLPLDYEELGNFRHLYLYVSYFKGEQYS